MLTKETLTAEVVALREQYARAQATRAAVQRQVAEVEATAHRLQGALVVSEKYLAMMDAQEDTCLSPNGTAPIPAP